MPHFNKNAEYWTQGGSIRRLVVRRAAISLWHVGIIAASTIAGIVMLILSMLA